MASGWTEAERLAFVCELAEQAPELLDDLLADLLRKLAELEEVSKRNELNAKTS